jgi:excisionase family DNA binding protein
MEKMRARYGKYYAMHNEQLGPMLTVREVARFLSVHVNTVRRWSDEGKLKAYRITRRGDRRFKQEDILLFLASSRVGDDQRVLEEVRVS